MARAAGTERETTGINAFVSRLFRLRVFSKDSRHASRSNLFPACQLPGSGTAEKSCAKLMVRCQAFVSRAFWVPATKSNKGARNGVAAKFSPSGTGGGTNLR